MKNAVIKTYVFPVVTGFVFLFLTGYWAYVEKRTFKEQTVAIISKQAEVLTESIKSIILSQMREGRIDKMGLEFILSNILYDTSLEYIGLRKGDSILFEIGKIPENLFTGESQGSVFSGGNYFYWKTVRFAKLPPPPPEMRRRMQFRVIHNNEDAPGNMPFPPENFFDFRESSQILLIGLDASVFLKQISEEDDKLAVTCMIAAFTILILIFTWIHFIKSNIVKLELEKATARNEKLEEMNLASAGLAHEVKNPLGLVRGFAQKISRTSDPGLINDLSFRIIDECDITAERISDFINYARRRPIDEKAVDSSTDVKAVVDMLRYEFDDRGISFAYEHDGIRILADREFLQQIIVNILMNSIQACKKGDIVSLKLKKRQNSAILTISDNGPGIDGKLMNRIFKPYVSGRVNGHGIGLAIVKKLVEEHGWVIAMSSKPGCGTETEISKIKLV